MSLGGRIATGFFTNDDGTDFYLAPLIGPDGLSADIDDDLVSITKSCFSVGGVGLVDNPSQPTQGREPSTAEKRAMERLAEIQKDIEATQMLGGERTPLQQDMIEATIEDWQSDIERRLLLLLSRIGTGNYSDDDLLEGIALAGEEAAWAATAQMFGLEGDNWAESDILGRIVQIFVVAISDSFELCSSTDLQQIEDSAVFRLKRFVDLQLLGRTEGKITGPTPQLPQGAELMIDLDHVTDYVECSYDIELSPEFTPLLVQSDVADVTLSGSPYNPVSRQPLAPFADITFDTLGAYEVSHSDNVGLGIISGNSLQFGVTDTDLGSVAISGGRTRGGDSATAQVVSKFAGLYTVDFSGTASSCTDPGDNGSRTGSFQIAVDSTLTSIFNDTLTYELTGSAGGLNVGLTLTETAGDPTAPVSGSGTRSGSEVETIDLGDRTVVCTYATHDSASLNGSALIAGDSVTISLILSNVSSTWTGSGGVCGTSGSCSVEGSATLTKLEP